MRIRRSLPILLGVLLVTLALTIVVQLRKHAPPEPARLLPGADGFVYLNLKWIRRANIAGQLPPVSHDPEYEQFIQATGFQFERDLDQAAFAIHYPVPPSSTNPIAFGETKFSEVFVGRIDGERLRSYLRNLSHSVEPYRSVDIYAIPLEGRTVRVAILGVDTVAASNHPDPLVIRGIIDRSRKLASPFAGPAFLRQYYKDRPIASLGWAIFRVNPAGQASLVPSALSFLFSQPAVIVASIRYLGKVHLRAEAFTGSEGEATHLAEQINTFISIFRAAETTVSAQATDPDLKAFFDGFRVEQHRNRVALTATVPPGLIRKAIAEPPAELAPQTPQTPLKQPPATLQTAPPK